MVTLRELILFPIHNAEASAPFAHFFLISAFLYMSFLLLLWAPLSQFFMSSGLGLSALKPFHSVSHYQGHDPHSACPVE